MKKRWRLQNFVWQNVFFLSQQTMQLTNSIDNLPILKGIIARVGNTIMLLGDNMFFYQGEAHYVFTQLKV